MIKISEQIIKEIADNLYSGMNCYYNKLTGEIKSFPDFDSWMGTDAEPWEEDLQELEKNWGDYLKFERMPSRVSFNLMADFTDTVDNSKLRDRLIHALNKSKPFMNFKWQIDNSGEYRHKWFDFKNMRYIEWVKDQVELLNKSDIDE